MFNQLVSVWINVLTHPSVRTFDAQKPQATRDRTLANVVIAAIVAAILAAIFAVVAAAFLSGLAGSLGGTPVYAQVVGPIAIARTFLSTLVNTFVGFFVFCYALQFVAERFFGGRGTFDEQAYLVSTYWAPINILVPILMFIPCLGQLVALALLVYALVLTTFAVQSGQGLPVGSAIISWLIAGVGSAIVMGILGWISGGWL